MIGVYHRQIIRDSLGGQFTEDALTAVIRGNLHQDHLLYQIGHPHFHMDDNSFNAAARYMQKQRELMIQILSNNQSMTLAWEAFGRLTHAAQDFYAHSNYVALWIAKYASLSTPEPETIEPIDTQILNSPQLRSGRIYHPWEMFSFIPGFGKLIKLLLPRDAHAWMNLDDPSTGPLFPYAIAAATKRTLLEYEQIQQSIQQTLGQQAVLHFRGLESIR